jgi:heat shock protein HslJ
MKHKTLFTQLAGCIITLVIGSVGGTITIPVMAQSFPEKPLQTAASASLMGNWRLVNMTVPTSPMPMLPLQTPELTAEFSDGRISGSGGCNRFNGGYQTQGEQLSIDPLASTFKACEQPIMEQETRYLKALQAAQRYEIDDQGHLSIFYGTEQSTGVLRFATQTTRALW